MNEQDEGTEGDGAAAFAATGSHAPEAEGAQPVIAIIDPGCDAGPVLREAKRLADALAVEWTALHVETSGRSEEGDRLGDIFTLASSMGANVVNMPASAVADGVLGYAAHDSPSHVVIGIPPRQPGLPAKHKGLIEALLASGLGAAVVAVPCGRGPAGRNQIFQATAGGAEVRAYLLSAALVAATFPVLLLLRNLMGAQGLALLLLFPVLTVAARFGFRPAIFASLLSAAAYNFFILKPVYDFKPGTPQDLLIVAALLVLAGYISMVTGRLRDRAALSDRTAQENARLANFGANLAKASDWESTADIVCREAAALFSIEAVLFREVDGRLTIAGAAPRNPVLAPLDRAALDWAWLHREEAGSGTAMVEASDWQFQPLKTSLGMLAVLGLARNDGRNPVRPERKVLLSTFLAQASLAHERLRLEDQMKVNSCP